MKKTTILTLAALLTMASCVDAQRLTINKGTLESADVAHRRDAFFDLVEAANQAAASPDEPFRRMEVLAQRARKQDELGLALIHLLEREQRHQDSQPKDIPYDEDYDQYYYW